MSGKTSRQIRHVEVVIKSQKRSMSIEVFAKKDPIRAAKRFVKEMGFGGLDFDWANAKVAEGPNASKGGTDLEGFEVDVLRGLLSGEIKTERIV